MPAGATRRSRHLLRHAQLGGPSPAFGMVDGQRAGGTPAKAAAPDPHMGCVYVMRLWSGLLSTSSPLIHFPNLLAVRYVGVEGHSAQARCRRRSAQTMIAAH